MQIYKIKYNKTKKGPNGPQKFSVVAHKECVIFNVLINYTNLVPLRYLPPSTVNTSPSCHSNSNGFPLHHHIPTLLFTAKKVIGDVIHVKHVNNSICCLKCSKSLPLATLGTLSLAEPCNIYLIRSKYRCSDYSLTLKQSNIMPTHYDWF